MPRVIDFTQGNETDWNEVRLPFPVIGVGEISDEELDATVAAFNAPVMGIESQFSTYGKNVPRQERAALFDAAHAWLSENTTGPWLWTEHWSNHGHSLDVGVYVERVPDQIAFAEAHANLFGYRPTEAYGRGNLAVERGVLPPFTAKESFSRWCDEHRGFDYLPSDDLGAHGCRVAFSHPELERLFVATWGEKFVREEGGTYAGSTEGTTWRNSPSIWLDKHGGVGNVSGASTPEGYRWTVETRFDDVADALARDWGHLFKRAPEGRVFSAETYPYPPQREIPVDFIAYLKGEADDYEAPHLPDGLRGFRSEAIRSPSP